MSTMPEQFAREMLASQLSAAIDQLAGPMDTSTRTLLEAKIYPTLVPAMEALLKEVERCKSNGLPEPQPLDWLGSYLMRHNPNAVAVPIPDA